VNFEDIILKEKPSSAVIKNVLNISQLSEDRFLTIRFEEGKKIYTTIRDQKKGNIYAPDAAIMLAE
jgi:hypothetical protein